MKLIVFITAMLLVASVACEGFETTMEYGVAENSPAPPNISEITGTVLSLLEPADDAVAVVVESAFTHHGFRTQATGESKIANIPGQLFGSTLTIYIRNLADQSGSVDSRVTINFGPQFDNYIDVPTSTGQLRLHLHRDGSLQTERDSGSFT